MFKFLKEKIKNTVKIFSKKVEEEIKTLEEVEKAKVRPEILKPLKKKEDKEEVKTLKDIEEVEAKKGIFSKVVEKIITKKIDEKQFENLFWDLEVTLLENNVAVEVIEKIKNDLKMDLINTPIKRGEIEKVIHNSLKESIEELFEVENYNLISKIREKKPYVIVFVGINGGGKTTSIAKIIKLLKDNKLSCVVAAADTFRSAAIEQLEEHTNKLGVKLIKHEYKSDPAAVCFDAVEHAKATGKDVVLIDTAGRLHSNLDLMNEMKKIVKVSKPDLKLFIGESITGNDVVEQVKQFNERIGIDGIILSKADIDDKGGAAISVSFVTKKPILYFGVGQGYSDLKKFDKYEILKNLGL